MRKLFSGLLRNFFKGCVVLVPTAVTVYVLWHAYLWGRASLPAQFGALGVVLAVLGVALIGWFATNVVGRRVLGFLDRVLARLPIVKLIYTFVRDLLDALAGDSRAFDHPVVVAFDEGPAAIKVFGFVTCEDLAEFGVEDHVAVYLPQSINFAGNLILVPRARVHPVETSGKKRLLKFVASGGVVRE